MFGSDEFMTSLDTLQKPGAGLDFDALDDENWLSSADVDVQCLVPDVDVCDQGPDFPIVPSLDAQFDEPDRGASLFDAGLIKAELSSQQQTFSSSSLESWQGDLAQPRPPTRPAQLKAGGMRRIETAASTLTAMDARDVSTSPISRVAMSGVMRPSSSMPDLTKAVNEKPSRGRNATVATSPPKNLGVDRRTLEQKRDDRMAALERFREKKRNRTFVKKVRYECRKQLADSRPRVKGRFVKKNEIGLFEKYGETYREHLDELDDCVVPSL